MITLIIFLCLLIIFYFIVYKKININLELNVKNFDYELKITFLKKEKIIKGSILEFSKSRKGKFDLEKIKEISSLININKLKTHIEIGTEFIFLTNVITVIISTVIPVLYNFPANSKKNLSFDIKPYYDRFYFAAEIKVEIELTLLEFLIIYFCSKAFRTKQ